MSRVTGHDALEKMRMIRDADSSQVFENLRMIQRDAFDYLDTLAWLYGREPDLPMHIHSIPCRTRNEGDDDSEYEDDVDIVTDASHLVLIDTEGGCRTVEQAEELARALLSAIERAKKHPKAGEQND